MVTSRTAWRLLVAGAFLALCFPSLRKLVEHRYRIPDVHESADAPGDLGPIGMYRTPLAPNDRNWVTRQMQPRTRPMNQGRCLHMLYLHGLDTKFDHARIPSGRDLVALFTQSRRGEEYFGSPCLVRTRDGVRFPTAAADSRIKSDEVHRDQTLAVLGQLGLPRSFPLVIDGQTATLEDVLRDSIANFYIDQKELEWTTWAYALYLPPQRSWTNRYGETSSFDDLVAHLIDRSMLRASCAGTHVLFSLTMIARADDLHPVLSDPMRGKLGRILDAAVSEAVRQQQSDGSWRLDWHFKLLPDEESRPAVRDDTQDRLLVTGHLGEWMLHLPERLQPPGEVYRRAALWLHETARETADRQDALFCPYTHALFFLKQGAEKPDSTVRGPDSRMEAQGADYGVAMEAVSLPSGFLCFLKGDSG